MHRRIIALLALGLTAPLLATGCTYTDRTDRAAADSAVATPASSSAHLAAEALGGDEPPPSPAELERGRLDESWRRFAEADSSRTAPSAPAAGSAADSTGSAGPSAAAAEKWNQISSTSVTPDRIATPVRGDVAGPSVLGVQLLLDRANFSPGLIDGRWGKNTEAAVFWLQRREGLPATGEVDQRTLERLRQLAGSPGSLVATRTLTQEDVKGPFKQLPGDVYERAKLECLCYQSLSEKLGERFHASPELLRQLNPGKDLDALKAGDQLAVPNVRPDSAAGAGTDIAKLVISDGGHYLHAVDATGRIIYHFPATLGSEYAPSPTGNFKVERIAWDPTWHYQPALLTGEPDDKPDAVLPPGPNNAVGVVWMELSKPHYGIHGTKAPETIGYATSHGCVRLTNWDARFLAQQLRVGVPVQFRDVQQQRGA